MADQIAQEVQVGHSLGFFALGASLHYILNRIKAEPSIYPKIQLNYSPSEPLLSQLVINLPTNGIRLNFDAPDQRLRYIEILDFSKTRLSYESQDIVKFPENISTSVYERFHVAGPTFKHVYKLFGATTPGEFTGNDGQEGKYLLSWPGISFWFSLQAPPAFSSLDWASTVSTLSSSACSPAKSMAIYDGGSWPSARKTIFTADVSFPRVPILSGRKEGIPAEVEIARVHHRGRIELLRKDAPPFWIVLSETTPQDLVTELGPPDSIYKKSHRTTSAHHGRRVSSASSRRLSDVVPGSRRSSSLHTQDSDENAAWTDEDDDEDDEETTTVANEIDKYDAGIWWNYYAHGLDILITQPTHISASSPTASRQHHTGEGEGQGQQDQDNNNNNNNDISAEEVEPTARNHLTATKLVIHSNVPGSYQFNRHRRLRWTLESWPSPSGEHTDPLTSEMKFKDIQARMKEIFTVASASASSSSPFYDDEEHEKEQQQPMAINRDWGEGSSLGGSVELLGGWEDSGGEKKRKKRGDNSGSGGGSGGGNGGGIVSGGEEKIGEVLMFGFPGMAFEVLKNGVVGLLQLW